MKTIYIKNTNYLAHHGVKGQKWGVRRYQNLDGSLTAAGKERYSTKSAFKDYSNSASKIWANRFSEYEEVERQKEKYEQDSFKKLGFNDWQEAYDKARAQNPDISSGKLKYKDSIWNLINIIEDDSDDIFNKKYSDVAKKYNKKLVENGEKFLDKIFKETEIKYKDVSKLGPKAYNYEHEEWYDNEWAEQLFDIMSDDVSKKYYTDWNDDGDLVIRKK